MSRPSRRSTRNSDDTRDSSEDRYLPLGHSYGRNILLIKYLQPRVPYTDWAGPKYPEVQCTFQDSYQAKHLLHEWCRKNGLRKRDFELCVSISEDAAAVHRDRTVQSLGLKHEGRYVWIRHKPDHLLVTEGPFDSEDDSGCDSGVFTGPTAAQRSVTSMEAPQGREQAAAGSAISSKVMTSRQSSTTLDPPVGRDRAPSSASSCMTASAIFSPLITPTRASMFLESPPTAVTTAHRSASKSLRAQVTPPTASLRLQQITGNREAPIVIDDDDDMPPPTVKRVLHSRPEPSTPCPPSRLSSSGQPRIAASSSRSSDNAQSSRPILPKHTVSAATEKVVALRSIRPGGSSSATESTSLSPLTEPCVSSQDITPPTTPTLNAIRSTKISLAIEGSAADETANLQTRNIETSSTAKMVQASTSNVVQAAMPLPKLSSFEITLLHEEAQNAAASNPFLEPHGYGHRDRLFSNDDMRRHGLRCAYVAKFEVTVAFQETVRPQHTDYLYERIKAASEASPFRRRPFFPRDGALERNSVVSKYVTATEIPSSNRFDRLFTLKDMQAYGLASYDRAQRDTEDQYAWKLEQKLRNLKRLHDLSQEEAKELCVTNVKPALLSRFVDRRRAAKSLVGHLDAKVPSRSEDKSVEKSLSRRDVSKGKWLAVLTDSDAEEENDEGSLSRRQVRMDKPRVGLAKSNQDDASNIVRDRDNRGSDGEVIPSTDPEEWANGDIDLDDSENDRHDASNDVRDDHILVSDGEVILSTDFEERINGDIDLDDSELDQLEDDDPGTAIKPTPIPAAMQTKRPLFFPSSAADFRLDRASSASTTTSTASSKRQRRMQDFKRLKHRRCSQQYVAQESVDEAIESQENLAKPGAGLQDRIIDLTSPSPPSVWKTSTHLRQQAPPISSLEI